MADSVLGTVTEEDLAEAKAFEDAARAAGFEPAKFNTFAQAGECKRCFAMVYKRGWVGHQEWHRTVVTK